MKNTSLINVFDYAIVVLKHFTSTAVAPHLPRWPPPAGPGAPGRRSASASPRTAGEKESEQRARSSRGAGRGTRRARALNYFGQSADLGQHPVGAVQVPAEAEPLRGKRRSARSGLCTPSPLPAAEPPPHHVAAAPRSALLSQNPPVRPGTTPGPAALPAPCPKRRWGAPVEALRGPFSRDLGTTEGRRRGRGGGRGSGTRSDRRPFEPPWLRPTERSRFPWAAASRLPPIPARLSAPCPITAALSIWAWSRQAQPAQARPGPSAPH